MVEWLPSVALLLLWGAAVSIDERTFPLRLHQPLLSGTVAGAIAGNLGAGVAAGAMVQAIWPALNPAGGNLLPSVGLAGVVAAGVAAWDARLLNADGLVPTGRGLFLGFCFALLVAWAGRLWESGFRTRNAGREERALASPLPLFRALRRAVVLAWTEAALRGWVLVGFSLALAGFIYRAMLVSGWRGGPLIEETGRGLFPAALGLGFGGLWVQLRERSRTAGIEILIGLGAGMGLSLLLAR